MKNNRIKKHSYNQIQQSFERVTGLCLTHKQKSGSSARGEDSFSGSTAWSSDLLSWSGAGQASFRQPSGLGWVLQLMNEILGV